MSGIALLLDRRERAYLSAVDAWGDLPTMSGIMGVFCQMASSIGSAVAMFFTLLEDARWSAERQAVEVGVEIGEYQGVVRVGPRVFQRCSRSGPLPSGASSLLPPADPVREHCRAESCAGAN